MPGLPRVGDLESGHDGYEPVRLATGSPNVFINGRKAGRVGDVYEAHGGHRDVIVSGSPRIFINGRPAARVGDTVRGGGSAAGGLRGARAAGDAEGTATVAQGSATVSIQPMDRDTAAIEIGFWASWIKVWTSHANKVQKLIAALPDIAEREAGNAAEEKDKIGWLLFSGFMRKWLSGKKGTDIYAVPPAWVDLDWVLSYPRALYAYEDIQRRLWNNKAKAELAKMAIEVLGDKNKAIFDFVTEHPGKRYFQYADVSSYGVIDGLTAALGEFSFRAIAKGKITRRPDGTFTIHVDEAYIVLVDSFDFEGTQPLGWWNEQQFGGLWPSVPYTSLWNKSFRDFSDKFGIGHNFQVRSKLVSVSVPEDYVYPLPEDSEDTENTD